jgi:hypothetical protein
MSPRILSGILTLAIAAGVPATMTACRVRAHGPVWIVDVEPPPPRRAVVAARPGWLWVEGEWRWIDGGWRWYEGYWERERPGYVWTPGVWVQVHNRWEWRAGRWESRARQREHRTPRPRVRDHR